MAKVTSKLQVPPGKQAPVLSLEDKLKLFDAATIRQKARERRPKVGHAADRGWRREDAYTRGRAR